MQGTMFSARIYTKIMGYQRAIILGQATWAEYFRNLRKSLDFEAHVSDVELDRYPREEKWQGASCASRPLSIWPGTRWR